MRISDWSSDVCSSDLQAVADGKRWVTGEIFGLPIPADAEALRSSGCEFLTTAFRASGALTADNGVSRIVGAEEFNGGGTGKKMLLTVAYERSGPGLPEQLFIKFSRNFDKELWDRACFLLISEAKIGRASGRERVCQYV